MEFPYNIYYCIELLLCDISFSGKDVASARSLLLPRQLCSFRGWSEVFTFSPAQWLIGRRVSSVNWVYLYPPRLLLWPNSMAHKTAQVVNAFLMLQVISATVCIASLSVSQTYTRMFLVVLTAPYCVGGATGVYWLPTNAIVLYCSPSS